MSSEDRVLKVLMLPWLAHGHITPFLELAKKLSERGFHCYICSTRVNLDPIQKRITGKYKLNIEPVDLRLQSSPELPPHRHTTNGLPLHLHRTLRNSLKKSKPEFLNLLETLKPDLLIHDVVVSWAGSVASKLGIASVWFHTSGATMLSYFIHLGRHPGKEFPFSAIRLSEFQRSTMFSVLKDANEEWREEADPDDVAGWDKGGILVANSTRAMEGKYMAYLSELLELTVLPIGALVREPTADFGVDGGDRELVDWLETKDESSTVFVSFGSEYFLTSEEICEIAHALELSGVSFIWVVRFPTGEEEEEEEEERRSVEDALPEGFLERVGEKGRVLGKWAPQAEILGHRSTGGFVSHCGWNSLRESVEFLVPIIAVPMHLDQPMNAKLVVELGAGVEVERDGEGALRREEIARVIRDVVLGEAGKSLRRRMAELRDDVRSKSVGEIDEVVEKLRERCGKCF